MIKKIIYFVESQFCKRDYRRFGIEILLNRGYEVEVWDFSPYLRPNYYNNYTPPDPINFDKYILIQDKDCAVKIIDKLSSKNVVICLMGINTRNTFIYDYLSKNNVIYGFLLCGLLPKIRTSLLHRIKKLLQNPSLLVKKINDRIKKNKISISPDFIIVGGKEAMYDGRYPICEQTKIIKAHALDYDRYLEEEQIHGDFQIQGKYTVFLDEYVPYHPDNITKQICSAESYYPRLNKFFNYIEDKLGLSVIVAAHPRATYDEQKNPFQGRCIIYGKTIELVKHSKLVLTHTSAAINFVVLYKKPMIFLSDSAYSIRFKNMIFNMASIFGKKPIDLSSTYQPDISNEFNIDHTMYNKYKLKYIKEPGTPEKPIWEIFADYCDKI